MIKNLKIMACAMMVLTMAGVMSSCKKEYKKQVVYKAGWAKYHFVSVTDAKIIQDYLVEKGALNINEYKFYDVTSNDSESDCLKQADEMAKADFANSTRDLKVEEIQSRITAGSSFVYNWFRTDDNGGEVEIGRWECPAIPIPSTFGKITVDGNEHSVTKASLGGSLIGETPAYVMQLKANKVNYVLTISNPEYSLLNPVVPIGEFSIDGVNNKCVVVVNEVKYQANGTVCTVSKNGAFYKLVSSGTATDENGNTIEFSVDCDQVVFN